MCDGTSRSHAFNLAFNCVRVRRQSMTSTPEVIAFGDFRLNPAAGELRCRGALRSLRAKSFAVLVHLARRPNQLVSAREVFRAVWPSTSVSATVLRVCIREIRVALGEDAGAHLLTVPRRGYRLVSAGNGGADAVFVGRAAEMAALHEALDRARTGRRQVVFVGGEAGSGKTALLSHFLDELRATAQVCIGRGDCLDLLQREEPFGPVSDLLYRLCGEVDGAEAVAALERWAPGWLARFPGHRDGAGARRHQAGPSRARWRGQLCEAIEHLAAAKPLVLWMANLQWSDAASVDLLAALAQRTTPARLLVVATYRATDLDRRHSPFASVRQRLHGRGLCTEIVLAPLVATEVGAYLAQRLPADWLGDEMTLAIHRHSGGHPLFLARIVDRLLAQRRAPAHDGAAPAADPLQAIVADAVGPLVASALRTMAADQRRVFEVASVSGERFAVASVAAAAGQPGDAAEALCADLVGQGRLVAAGVEAWPDGTVSGRYQFAQPALRDVLYRQLPALDRLRLHRAIGERIAAGHATPAGDVAAELARHFTLAGDHARAVPFHVEAARVARQGCDWQAELDHLRAALALLRALPATIEREAMTIRLLLKLGAATGAASGDTAQAVGDLHEEAGRLAERHGLLPAQMMAVAGLHAYHMARGDLSAARQTADQLLMMSERNPASLAAVAGHTAAGSVLFSLGEFWPARGHLERAASAWTTDISRFALDLAVVHRGGLALTRLAIGESAAAATAIRSLADCAIDLPGDAFNAAQAHALAAHFHAAAADRAAARYHAERALGLGTRRGVLLRGINPAVVRGWAVGDAAAIRAELSAQDAIGHRLGRPFAAALLAETLLDQEDVPAALASIAEGLAVADTTGEERHVAELHRLRGECLLRHEDRRRRSARRPPDAAVASFRTALAVARRQHAVLWEQRAARSLAAARRRRSAARAE